MLQVDIKDYPGDYSSDYSGLLETSKSYSRGYSPDTLHSARVNLQQNNFTLVRSLYHSSDISYMRELLSSYYNSLKQNNLSLKHKFLDNDQNITELPRLIKFSSEFENSSLYQRSFDFASALFGAKCRYGFDHAIFKEPGSEPVRWHQDQIYSKGDLQKQCLSFWIPMHPVNPSDGGMEYAGNQHQLLPHTPVSANSTTFTVDEQYLDRIETISPNLEPGDVCIHTPMSLHRSHPNTSNRTRVAWIIQFNRYGLSRFFRWRNLARHAQRFI